ncbi:hypothetical protein LB507_007428 [Fusarium sp. FIESC RH6]|nr:hypothetical protein LB507_007428 [Fusarium sp. FIESC RH6]
MIQATYERASKLIGSQRGAEYSRTIYPGPALATPLPSQLSDILLSTTKLQDGITTPSLYPRLLRPTLQRRSLQSRHFQSRRRTLPGPGRLHRMRVADNRYWTVQARGRGESRYREGWRVGGDA